MRRGRERRIVRIKMGVGGKVGLNPIELSRSRFWHYSSPGQAMPSRKGLDARNRKRYAWEGGGERGLFEFKRGWGGWGPAIEVSAMFVARTNDAGSTPPIFLPRLKRLTYPRPSLYISILGTGVYSQNWVIYIYSGHRSLFLKMSVWFRQPRGSRLYVYSGEGSLFLGLSYIDRFWARESILKTECVGAFRQPRGSRHELVIVAPERSGDWQITWSLVIGRSGKGI